MINPMAKTNPKSSASTSENLQIQWLQTNPKSSASTNDSATCSYSSSCLRALGKLFLTKPVPTPRKISLQRTKRLQTLAPIANCASNPCSTFGHWACRWSTIANCASNPCSNFGHWHVVSLSVSKRLTRAFV